MSKVYTLREWFAVALTYYKVSHIQIIPLKRYRLLCLFSLLRLLFSLICMYPCIVPCVVISSFAFECSLYIKLIVNWFNKIKLNKCWGAKMQWNHWCIHLKELASKPLGIDLECDWALQLVRAGLSRTWKCIK